MANAPAASWVDSARRLSDSGSHRRQAIAELRKISDLDKKLLAALDSDNRHYAYDVISALNKRKFVPELLSRAAQDGDGFSVLALNVLLHSSNATEIGQHYAKALSRPRTKVAPAAAVGMFDALGRMGWKLARDEVKKWLEHDYYEVKSAALYYIRTMTVKHNERGYLALLPQVLKAKPYQLRWQAVSFIGELEDAGQFKRFCLKDKNIHVKTLCRALPEP